MFMVVRCRGVFMLIGGWYGGGQESVGMNMKMNVDDLSCVNKSKCASTRICRWRFQHLQDCQYQRHHHLMWLTGPLIYKGRQVVNWTNIRRSWEARNWYTRRLRQGASESEKDGDWRPDLTGRLVVSNTDKNGERNCTPRRSWAAAAESCPGHWGCPKIPIDDENSTMDWHGVYIQHLADARSLGQESQRPTRNLGHWHVAVSGSVYIESWLGVDIMMVEGRIEDGRRWDSPTLSCFEPTKIVRRTIRVQRPRLRIFHLFR